MCIFHYAVTKTVLGQFWAVTLIEFGYSSLIYIRLKRIETGTSISVIVGLLIPREIRDGRSLSEP